MHVGFEVISAGSSLDEGQGGASGYIEGLLPAMLADPRVHRLTAYVADWYKPASRWSHPKLTVRPCRAPRARPGRVAYEQVRVPQRARGDRIDVLFSTGNFRPLLYRAPNVLALHAIQYFLLDDRIGRIRGGYLRSVVPRSVRSADVVVAVTETLRRDTIALFDLDPERIVSVPMGPSPWVLDLLDEGAESVDPYRESDGAPYILSISRLYALKNHRRLIQGFAQLLDEQELPHKLLIVGGDADVTRAELEKVALDAGIADRVVFLGRVAQELVPALYRGATAVAYVSLYETFGHPVLEAFATESPLVTSSTGAAAEVAGGAARLVDPRDVQSIAAGLGDVVGDEGLRRRMAVAGRRRVRDFSWERCARGTVDALALALLRREKDR